MDSIDTAFRATRFSLRAHLGSLFATIAVFSVIATTGIRVSILEPSQDEAKPVYYLAPPEDLSELQASKPELAEPIDNSSINLEDSEPDVALDINPLEMAFDLDAFSEFTLNFDLNQGFQASSPVVEEFEAFTIYDQSEVDQKPVLRVSSIPRLPQRLRGEEADVVVFYYVTNKGKTERPSVLFSTSENPIFAEAAVEAIKNWRFRPARKNGKSVACWVQQTIKFEEGNTSPFSI